MKPTKRLKTYHWPATNWSLTNEQIATRTGFSRSHVAAQRRRYHGPPERPKINWSLVDWRLTNRQIATLLDVPPSRVQSARRHGCYPPPTTNPRQGPWRSPSAQT